VAAKRQRRFKRRGWLWRSSSLSLFLSLSRSREESQILSVLEVWSQDDTARRQKWNVGLHSSLQETFWYPDVERSILVRAFVFLSLRSSFLTLLYSLQDLRQLFSAVTVLLSFSRLVTRTRSGLWLWLKSCL